ncbi:hypothetical protein [Novosphingobium sp. ST904]|uniref:hypothetical protein n=2 Tax=Novosphingobium sp. ST904 TaxID=1684385 RepID=UPI00104B544B|nr:hypothetical protein [Novosphingobium sp. ST904]TCM40114.1 hypothetical protein EDF59_105354 [Novosphingobium sp. ST904]
MKLTLVAHWRLWWRRWSTWLAGVWGALVTLVLSDPQALAAVGRLLPERHRPLWAIGVGLLTWAAPVILTQIRQPRLERKRNGS